MAPRGGAGEVPDPRIQCMVNMYNQAVHMRSVRAARYEQQRKKADEAAMGPCTFSPRVNDYTRVLLRSAASPSHMGVQPDDPQLPSSSPAGGGGIPGHACFTPSACLNFNMQAGCHEAKAPGPTLDS